MADLSSETTEASRHWNNVFKALKGKNHNYQTRILYSEKLSSKNKGNQPYIQHKLVSLMYKELSKPSSLYKQFNQNMGKRHEQIFHLKLYTGEK